MRLVSGSAFLCLASFPVVAAGAQPRAGETLESRALWRTAGDVHVAIGCGGVSVEPDATLAPHGAAWQLALRTRALRRADVRVDVGDPFVELRERDVALRFDGCTEWFVRDARGVEHGWTITTRLAGGVRAPLELEIEVAGLVCEISADGRDALFVDESGTPRVRYEHLRAWDALGRDLAVRIAIDDAGLAIAIDDRNAAYPITVDPILSGAAWMVGDSTGVVTAFGGSVASAGDVNADGYDDVVVGAPYTSNGHNAEGRAYLYLGGFGGLSTTPAWTFEPDLASARFGASVAGVGDVDGDGYDDVVVGSSGYANVEPEEGAAFLFRGTASGLQSTPSWTAESNQATAFFGARVAAAGDVDGDGYADVVVSAAFFDTTLADVGRIFLYLGSAGGLATTPAWTYSGMQADETLGYSLSGAGDVDGDGFDDVLVGDPWYTSGGNGYAGRVLLFRGRPTGLAASPAWNVAGTQPNEFLATSIAGAGDVDRDGFDDVIVAAPGFASYTGTAFVYRGGPGGLSTTPVWTAPGNGDQFGFVVDGAGDVDSDGYDDVVVAALNVSNGQFQEGRVYAFRGSPSGPVSTPDWSFESDDTYAHFGAALAGALDVNADGLSDVVVGTNYFTVGSGAIPGGRAYAFHGLDDTHVCAGDGSASACPCGNFGARGNGCANSVFASGGRLDRVGFASVATDTLELLGTNMPNTSALFFQGSALVAGGAGVAFGDGLRCAGGTVIRLGTKTNVGGASSYPTGGDLPISVRGQVAPGDVRVYQLWYRNAATYCTSSTFNLTNGVELLWGT